MLERDNRMVDTQIIANLMRSTSFFASTTMFIIAGLIAVLGAREQAMAVLAELPFAVAGVGAALGPQGAPADGPVRLRLLQVHLGVPAVQLLPDPGRLRAGPGASDRRSGQVAERLARIASSTGQHSNRGIRAYYFGLAALSWFIHPWLFMLLTVWVVLVLYRREFHSRLLATLALEPEEEAALLPRES